MRILIGFIGLLDDEDVPGITSPDYVVGKAYFLAHAKQTTGIATINRSVLAGFPLMLPGVSEQLHVARTVAEQAAVVRQAAELELTAIVALPAALLRQAFSGEL